MIEIFNTYDCLLLPTAPVFPWKIGAKIDNPVSTYLADIFTVLANLIGSPAVSIPLPAHENDFTVNIQILTAKHKESHLFGILDSLQN
jgi:aspartyl-tRNA(Asn)/glutamyl-tRNA(Gln) amidotransferase subunit A